MLGKGAIVKARLVLGDGDDADAGAHGDAGLAEGVERALLQAG